MKHHLHVPPPVTILAGFASLALVIAMSTSAAPARTVLVEAEQFAQRGGWVVDPQFMDIMGSPYLLAHGLGTPVADAVTEVKLPAAGTYRVFVRTMDWVARWKAPGAPGRFQLLVNGRPLDTTFGTEGANWHWQDGGTIQLPSGKVTLALHDLTGFEGRCDAILFTTDSKLVPPNTDPKMAELRRELLGLPKQPGKAGAFDLVVAGGGMAGTCAAISAARLGLKVALVQDRPVLGGNNSSEVRVWLQGARNKEPYPRIGDVVAELEPSRRAHYGPENTADIYEDEKKLTIARAETNLTLFLEHRVTGAETSRQRIREVLAQDIVSGKRIRIAGRWFADCTGDAALGAVAGADFELTPEGHMGPCNLWNVCECDDTNALNTTTAELARPVSFPRCPWALDLSDKPFPGRGNVKPDPIKDGGWTWERSVAAHLGGGVQPDPLKLGGWYWESGFDRDPITEIEYVRDWNFRAMYGAWDALKNVDKVLPNHRLEWAAYILGKRESRRLLGDVILTKQDLVTSRAFPDGCVPTGWKIDLHLPDPRYEKGFEGDAFISRAEFGNYPQPYWIPYRCFYSRNIANLFMGGRDVSVTHEALGAVRVMRTGGCMGEVIGMAASVCKKHGDDPRAVYEQHLAELQELMRRGVGRNPGARPEYANGGEPASSRGIDPTTLPGLMLDDDRAKLSGNWSTRAVLEHVGGRYLYAPARARASARFEFTVKTSGRYEVRLAYQSHENRASNTAVTVHSADGAKSLKVNQRAAPPIPPLFVSLGVFRFEADKPGAVELTSAGANGYVSVDAVQVLPVE